MKITYQVLLIYAILNLTTVSCRVNLVSEYSQELETQIINGAKMNDRLYIDLLKCDTAKRNYQLFADRYANIEAEINSIRFKNETRKNPKSMNSIVDTLKNIFKKYENEHKDKVSALTNGEIIIYQSYIKAFWTPLLVTESGLKKAK
jgi:hypothetical protein